MSRKKNKKIITKDISNINYNIKKKVALLVYSSLPKFYDLFFYQEKNLIDSIIKQLNDKNSELGNTKVFFSKKELIGILSFYDIKEAAIRQSISLKIMVNDLNNNKEIFYKLNKYRKLINNNEENSFYLARIAVNPKYRRCGFGKILMNKFEKKALSKSFNKLSLHVYSANIPAFEFYKKQGYIQGSLSKKNKSFILMKKCIKL